MKSTEIRKLKLAEITDTIGKKRQELSETSQNYRTKEVKNVRVIRSLRKDIARLLTIKDELMNQETNNA